MKLDNTDLRQAIELRDKVEQMTKTEGWEFFTGLLEAQVSNRMQQIMGPPDAANAEMKNYLTGEVGGLCLAQKVLQTLHSTAEDVIHAIRTAEEEQAQEMEREDGQEEEGS